MDVGAEAAVGEMPREEEAGVRGGTVSIERACGGLALGGIEHSASQEMRLASPSAPGL